MNYIHLGCGYRLHRLDSMNWELESVDLEQALDRADGIKRELLEATADLRKVE